MINYLERIRTLPAEIIQDFRKTKKSIAIPPAIQEYILRLDAAMEIRLSLKTDNISRIARELIKRIPEITFRNAWEIVHDTYTFFHVNSNITRDVWDAIYADKMEDLATVCINNGNDNVAFKAIDKAHEYRTNIASVITPDMLKAPVYIISMNIKAEDIGFKSVNLYEINRKDLEGHYLKMINSFDVDPEERKRLLRDANIQDAQIIEEDD